MSLTAIEQELKQVRAARVDSARETMTNAATARAGIEFGIADRLRAIRQIDRELGQLLAAHDPSDAGVAELVERRRVHRAQQVSELTTMAAQLLRSIRAAVDAAADFGSVAFAGPDAAANAEASARVDDAEVESMLRNSLTSIASEVEVMNHAQVVAWLRHLVAGRVDLERPFEFHKHEFVTHLLPAPDATVEPDDAPPASPPVQEPAAATAKRRPFRGGGSDRV